MNERKDSNLQEQDTMTATNIDKELESLCARLENVENEFGEAREVHKSARDGILTEAKTGLGRAAIAQSARLRAVG